MLEEKHENFLAAVRMWEMLVPAKMKMSGGKKKKKKKQTGTHTTLPP